MTSPGGEWKECPVCLEAFERRHYENPKRWRDRVFCSTTCRDEGRQKPILVGIIRPGGLTLEEIAIVSGLHRTSVMAIYDSAVSKFRKRMGRYVGIRRP